MNRLSSICIHFLLTLWCLGVMACIATPGNLEEKAASHYQHKEYAEALEVWYNLIEDGHGSASVYYNIGLAESQLDNIPSSILALEKASRIRPLNKDIQQALAQERKKIENGAIPVNPFFLQQGYKGLLSILRPGWWALLGLSLLLIVVATHLALLKRKAIKSFRNRNLRLITAGLGILCLIICGLAYKQLYREDEAIVISTCAFRQAPSEESPQITTLHPGEKAIIKDQIGDWNNIYLINLEAGWIKKDCLKPILIGTK